jgi:eukaryotic-like serine/threonine-protein kinase
MHERSIFAAALDIADNLERSAYLDKACGHQPGLKQHIEELIAAQEKLGSFLANPQATAPTRQPFPRLGEGPGTIIGPYKLLQQIGEGGMGVVYMAEQIEPVRRKVALKIIKPGMDTQQVIARFEAERQALAMMDHQNIARVFDAGATESGRPFFVMELVHGVPITKFCDDNKLTTRERLELFIPVCQAIQHAHQKGIIHRDVKPSNVLVTMYDDKAVPKVIDFGVAKAVEQRLTEKTMFTQYGALVGTFEYMSPEQAEMNAFGVDTRSDIYSLGVLLYELLTGTTPLERKRLREAALDELLRLIREEEPPRPSDRLTRSSDLPNIAAARKTEPARLSRLVHGDVDWIVMRCLEKDRTRRYETANGLARDIDRYLHDETVEATPPRASYRLRKFLRRNKGPALTASFVFLVLTMGLAGTAWGLFMARQQMMRAQAAAREAQYAAEQAALQRKQADEQRDLAEKRKQQALENEKKAISERQISQAVQTFLQQDLLRQTDATEQANAMRQLGSALDVKANPTIRELLDRAAAELTPAKIEGKFPGQRGAQASILKTVGDSYRGIGAYDRALDFLTRAIDISRELNGADNPETLAIANDLGLAFLAAGKLPQATALFEHALDVQVKTLGEDHPDTLKTLINLAWANLDAGKFPASIELYKRVLASQMKKLGPDHADTLNTMHYLAGAYLYSGKLAEAIALYESASVGRTKTLGANHPETIATLNNLAVAYQDAGEQARAIAIFEQVLQARLTQLGADHPDTLSTMNFLITAYRTVGKREQALPLMQRVVEGMERHKFQHQYAGPMVANLLEGYEQFQRFAEAGALRQKWLAAVKDRAGADSPTYASELALSGLSLLKQKKWADAEPMLRECLAIREKAQANSWSTFNSKCMLGEALAGQQKYAEAEPLLLAGFDGMKQREASIPPSAKYRLTQAQEWLVQLYDAWGKHDKAAQWRQKQEKKDSKAK